MGHICVLKWAYAHALPQADRAEALTLREQQQQIEVRRLGACRAGCRCRCTSMHTLLAEWLGPSACIDLAWLFCGIRPCLPHLVLHPTERSTPLPPDHLPGRVPLRVRGAAHLAPGGERHPGGAAVGGDEFALFKLDCRWLPCGADAPPSAGVAVTGDFVGCSSDAACH